MKTLPAVPVPHPAGSHFAGRHAAGPHPAVPHSVGCCGWCVARGPWLALGNTWGCHVRRLPLSEGAESPEGVFVFFVTHQARKPVVVGESQGPPR